MNQTEGWFLRHRDGVEHGPFRLADLVSAAQAGNVASDTCVRHATHTRGQWVVAMRLQPIAQVMERGETAAGSPTTDAEQSRPAERRQPQNATSSRTLPEHQANPVATVKPSANPDSAVPATVNATIRTATVDEGFPVPRTFLDALQVILTDFRFRRFVTPWIVKILWAISVAAALMLVLALAYGLFIQPSMSAPGPRTSQGQWEFEPLQGQSFFQTRLFVFLVWIAGTTIGMLWLRMLMELIVVFFRVSGDLVELRKFLSRS